MKAEQSLNDEEVWVAKEREDVPRIKPLFKCFSLEVLSFCRFLYSRKSGRGVTMYWNISISQYDNAKYVYHMQWIGTHK